MHVELQPRTASRYVETVYYKQDTHTCTQFRHAGWQHDFTITSKNNILRWLPTKWYLLVYSYSLVSHTVSLQLITIYMPVIPGQNVWIPGKAANARRMSSHGTHFLLLLHIPQLQTNRYSTFYYTYFLVFTLHEVIRCGTFKCIMLGVWWVQLTCTQF